jgi:hypothetical protein
MPGIDALTDQEREGMAYLLDLPVSDYPPRCFDSMFSFYCAMRSRGVEIDRAIERCREVLETGRFQARAFWGEIE